jgi:hypothetical protein
MTIKEKDLEWFKKMLLYMLVPLPIAAVSYAIGFFIPAGFIVAGIAIFIFLLYIGFLQYFVKELGEKKGDPLQTPKHLREWKNMLRLVGVIFFFLGAVFILPEKRNLSEHDIGTIFFGLGCLCLGALMIATTFRKYETKPDD